MVHTQRVGRVGLKSQRSDSPQMGFFNDRIQRWLRDNDRKVGYIVSRSGLPKSTVYRSLEHGGMVEDKTLLGFELATGIPFSELKREAARDAGVRVDDELDDPDIRAVIELMAEQSKRERQVIRAGVEAQVSARRGQSVGRAKRRTQDEEGETGGA